MTLQIPSLISGFELGVSWPCEVQPQMFRMLSCLQGSMAGFRGPTDPCLPRQGQAPRKLVNSEDSQVTHCNLDSTVAQHLSYSISCDNDAFCPILPSIADFNEIQDRKPPQIFKERI